MSRIHIGYVFAATGGRERARLDGADEVTLRYACFLGDLILRVGDLDASARWGWVPILDFALGLRIISERLTDASGDEVFEFTESDASIRFRRTNDKVVIDPSYVPGTGEVSLAELTASSSDFLGSLLQDLSGRYPELVSNAFIAALSKRGTAGRRP